MPTTPSTVTITNATAASQRLGKASLSDQRKTVHGSFFVYGTFGGATVVLQRSPDGGTTKFNVLYDDGSPVQFTTQGDADLRPIPVGIGGGNSIEYYATVTGATGTTNLTAILFLNGV